MPFGTALTKTAFNTMSVVTTTGYASIDYLQWGAFAAAWFFMLTFVGGCAGSTAGGPKIFRYQVMFRLIGQHIRKTIHPHAIVPLRYGTRTLSDEQMWSVGAFVFLYFAAFSVSAILLALIGLDPATALSGAATALGNVGAGIGPIIGPAGNFSTLPDAAKLVLTVTMIMGAARDSLGPAPPDAELLPVGTPSPHCEAFHHGVVSSRNPNGTSRVSAVERNERRRQWVTFSKAACSGCSAYP